MFGEEANPRGVQFVSHSYYYPKLYIINTDCLQLSLHAFSRLNVKNNTGHACTDAHREEAAEEDEDAWVRIILQAECSDWNEKTE